MRIDKMQKKEQMLYVVIETKRTITHDKRMQQIGSGGVLDQRLLGGQGNAQGIVQEI